MADQNRAFPINKKRYIDIKNIKFNEIIVVLFMSAHSVASIFPKRGLIAGGLINSLTTVEPKAMKIQL